MYMFFWFFKQLFYICKRLTKHKFLLLLLFFIIALFLFFKPVKATTTWNGYTLIDPPTSVINYLHSTTEYNNNNYYWFVFGYNGYHICTFPKPNNFKGFFATPMIFRTNSSFTYKQYNLNYNGTLQSINNDTVTSSTTWGFGINNDNTVYYMSNFNVYSYYSQNTVIYSYFQDPTITNSSSSISSWNFNTLNINCGSVPTDSLFELQYYYDNELYYIENTNDYKNISGSSVTLSIPRNIITNNIVIRNNSTISFNLHCRVNTGGVSQVFLYNLGSYTLSLTDEEANIINENNDKELISSIESSTNRIESAVNEQTEAINNQTDAINEQTDAINNQTDYLQDDTVNNSSIYLPSDNTNDITQDGLNGIFTTIYNAFCTGQAQDIVFPIPFTNKNISLQPNYIRNMLQNNNASWVITFISAFWWFLISRFIVKDITNKITKIKSGNIEDIETSNIKGDML